MRFRLKWVFVALLVVVAGQSRVASGRLPTVRIGLLQHLDYVGFSGPEGVSVEALRGDGIIAWVPAGERRELRVTRGQLELTGGAASQALPLETGLRLLPPDEGVVTISGIEYHWDGLTARDFRGTIEIKQDGYGSLTVVNVIDTETYLRGVVPSEMPARYPMDALRAQAVAARGQVFIKAGRHRREGFDLCATQHCQVYGGATSEDPRSDLAVLETWGEVLEYDRVIADTLYSSTCGGHTVNNEDYWPEQEPSPYLRGCADYDYDVVQLSFPLPEEQLHDYLKYAPPVNCNQPKYARSSAIRWWSVLRRAELETTLTERVGDVGELLDLQITERADTGIVQEIEVIGTRGIRSVRGPARIRYALGGLNSASFTLDRIGEDGDRPVAYVILGAGWGHQVGMCQVGAAGLADSGWDYRRILSKYYPECRLVRRY